MTRDAQRDFRDTNRSTARDFDRESDDSFDSGRSTRDQDRFSRDSQRDTDRFSSDRDASDRYSSDRQERYGRDTDSRSTSRDFDRRSRDFDRDSTRDARADFRSDDRFSRDRDTSRASFDSTTRDRYTSRSYSADIDVNTIRPADFGLWFDTGARGSLVISDVATSGPIARLGFHEGDRIVEVHGHRVRSERDFVRYLLDEEIRDERVEIVVLRDGREEVIYVEPTVLIEEMHAGHHHHDPLEEIGIVIDDRYDDRVVVWKVLPRTPAFYAGVRPGDVIATWHGRRISRPDSFVRVVTESDPGEVAIGVRRQNRVRDLQLEVPELQAQASAGRRTAFRPDYEDNLDRRLDRREDRREFREERREDRMENRDNYGAGFAPQGADINIGAPGAGVRIGTPGYGQPGAGVRVDTPGADVNIDANRGGGLFPRLRGNR